MDKKRKETKGNPEGLTLLFYAQGCRVSWGWEQVTPESFWEHGPPESARRTVGRDHREDPLSNWKQPLSRLVMRVCAPSTRLAGTGTLSTALSPGSSRCCKKTTPNPQAAQSKWCMEGRGARTAVRLPRVTAEAPWLQNSLEDTAGPLEVMPAAVQEAGEEAHAYSSSTVRHSGCLPQPTLKLSSHFLTPPLALKFQLSL